MFPGNLGASIDFMDGNIRSPPPYKTIPKRAHTIHLVIMKMYFSIEQNLLLRPMVVHKRAINSKKSELRVIEHRLFRATSSTSRTRPPIPISKDKSSFERLSGHTAKNRISRAAVNKRATPRCNSNPPCFPDSRAHTIADVNYREQTNATPPPRSTSKRSGPKKGVLHLYCMHRGKRKAQDSVGLK